MQKTCLKCGHIADLDPSRMDCPSCGAIYHVVESLVAQGKAIVKIKSAEVQAAEQALEEQRQAEAARLQLATAWTSGDWSSISDDVFETERTKVVITTTDALPGAQITAIAGIVSAECVMGLDLLDDYLMAFSDLLGGRSNTAQDRLGQAKDVVVEELKVAAMRKGADAVVAARFSYSEVSGKDKSMLLVALTGTAVRTDRLGVARLD